MSQVEIENLLYKTMGLDAASIGASAIERAIQARMAQSGAKGVEDYWFQLRSSATELQELVEAVVVPETSFFRHREAFGALNRYVMEEWASRHPSDRLRILSIPCSTGEEPYSIVMSLLDAGLPPGRFTVEAWDISHRALAQARRAIYGKNSFRGQDLGFRERYFQMAGDNCQVIEAVRAQVQFYQKNLLAPEHQSSTAQYDILFCRNVLIYFDRPTQAQALATLKHLLTPQGIAFVGPAEALLMRAAGFSPTSDPMSFAFVRAAAPRLQTPVAQPWKPVSTQLPLAHKTSAGVTSPVTALKKHSPLASTFSSIASPPVSVPAQRPSDDLEKVRQLADAGRTEEASRLCDSYLRENSNSVNGHYLKGVIHDAQGDQLGAAQSYRKALYLDPNHTEALAHLTLLAQKRGDLKEARLLQERAKRIAKGGTDKS